MADVTAFKGSVPPNYDRHLGVLFFEPYAADMAERIRRVAPGKVLEIACGTGIVTRRLREALPATSELVATDLNRGMMGFAQSKEDMPMGIEWQQADAQELPFEDASFDAVVCSFGFMFLPDKPKGLSEAFRVLKPGGTLLFNTWDKLEANWCSNTVHRFLQAQFPESPPAFFLTPYGWNDVDAIKAMLQSAGFENVSGTAVDKVSVGPSAESVATGGLMGTPVFVQLADRGVDAASYVQSLAKTIEAEMGDGEIRAPMRAIVFEARKPGA